MLQQRNRSTRTMTADKKAVTQSDYIPISTSVIHSIELVKPNVLEEQKDELGNEFQVPLTPSPSDPSENESFTDKLVDEAANNMFYSNFAPDTAITSPFASPFTQTNTVEPPPGYYTPPTPFLTPSPAPDTPQTFLFDPAFIPQIYSYPLVTNLPQSLYVPTEPAHHQPPAKRPKTSKSARKGSAATAKSRKNNQIAKSVQDMRSSLLEYHNAASDEIWRAGGEPSKKNKHCQTTFRAPIQLSSFEDFAGLAVLLSVFGKEASDCAGKRYGAKPA